MRCAVPEGRLASESLHLEVSQRVEIIELVPFLGGGDKGLERMGFQERKDNVTVACIELGNNVIKQHDGPMAAPALDAKGQSSDQQENDKPLLAL